MITTIESNQLIRALTRLDKVGFCDQGETASASDADAGK